MPLSVARFASKVCQLGDCADRLAHARHACLQPEYSCCSLLMPSGEIYLRLKPYLVVKIASDVLTEHCCQVCVLAMIFCRSDCRLCAGMCGKWLRNHGKLLDRQRTTCFGLLTLRQANIMGYKQRVLMHGHQGWNVRHGLCHIYMIYVYIWVVYSFCLFCCLFIIVTTQFVALYKPCKPKPKPSAYDPLDNHPLAEIQIPILRREPKQRICHQHANTDHFGK